MWSCQHLYSSYLSILWCKQTNKQRNKSLKTQVGEKHQNHSYWMLHGVLVSLLEQKEDSSRRTREIQIEMTVVRSSLLLFMLKGLLCYGCATVTWGRVVHFYKSISLKPQNKKIKLNPNCSLFSWSYIHYELNNSPELSLIILTQAPRTVFITSDPTSSEGVTGLSTKWRNEEYC